MTLKDNQSNQERNMLKITTGKRDVIETGSVISFNDEPIEFALPTRDSDLTFTIIFDTPTSTTEIGWKKEIVNETKVIIRLINFDSQIGVGFLKPEQIAIIGGRSLYIALFARKINLLRSLQYTFYIGERII